VARTRTPLPAPLKRLVVLLVVGFVAVHFLLPQLAGAHHALDLLGQVRPGYLVLAVALELAAIGAYTRLTRAVLPHGAPPGGTLLRIQLSTLAVSHVVPGGNAAGSALGYRLLTQAGVTGPDAAFALATQGIGSAVVLNVILWLGLLVSIPLRGYNPLYATAGLVGLVLIGGFAAIVVLLLRGETRAVGVLRAVAGRIPFLAPDRVAEIAQRLAARLRDLAGDRSLVGRAVVWAAANWLLDAASLWVFVGAFGHWVPVDGLIVAFGLANVLAALPVTPAGLGVVELVLVPTLVGFGTPRGVALLGVVAYRLVNFWLPIPVGALAYLSLRAGPWGAGRRAEALRRLAEQSLAEAEDRRTWAERHGVRVAQPDEPDGPHAPPGD
jgi:putative heme transporter